jgi:hypothetical protein
MADAVCSCVHTICTSKELEDMLQGGPRNGQMLIPNMCRCVL